MFVICTKNHATFSASPKLLLIQPNIVGNTLILTAPGMPEFQLNISDLYKIEPSVTHADHPQGAVDCGSEIAIWLSQYITGNEEGNRLVFYPDVDLIRNDRNNRLKLKETGFKVRNVIMEPRLMRVEKPNPT